MWGATGNVKQGKSQSWFQSTHPCGVRLPAKAKIAVNCSFNPRTRVGCDVHQLSVIRGDNSFNPRTRVGCDGWWQNEQLLREVSIHAPVWGATLVINRVNTFKQVSIHAPVWGATLNRLNISKTLMFQSTHPCGVRQAED